MDEFEMIARYFAPLGPDGLKDDAAVLQIPDGHELVVTSDTLNEGTHFWKSEDPAFIAQKALRVNVSDLYAMGAQPFCYQLCLAFPEKPAAHWLKSFASALEGDQKRYGLFCSGGDTTMIKGAFSVSITALGLVPSGRALRRAGARVGDMVAVSGPVGSAFLGLKILQGGIPQGLAGQEYFLESYRVPSLYEGPLALLRDHAHAGIDISDGLLADLGHICSASGVGAVVRQECIPLSHHARALVDSGGVTLEQLASGGDDYRLLLAIPPKKQDMFAGHFSVIGYFEAGPAEVRVQDRNGGFTSWTMQGWKHF